MDYLPVRMTPAPNRWNALLLLPALLAVAVIWPVLATWAGRLPYPFDLEWMEGGVMAHAWRVQHAQPLYVAPSPDFIPMIYPPGYYYVVAVLGYPFGLGLPLGRAVSIVGTLAACGALVWASQRRAGNPLLGLLGAAFFLGCYEDSGAFYDLVRPDALALGFLAWALVLGLEAAPRLQVLSGLLLFAAFVTKHNNAAYGLPIALGVWALHGQRAAWRFGLAAAVPGLAYTAFMQVNTSGHFLGYLWSVPASHPSVLARWVPGTVRETGAALMVPCLALAAWLLSLGPRVAPSVPVPAHVIPAALGAGLAVWGLGGMPEVQGIPASTLLERTAAYVLVGASAVAIPVALAGQIQHRRFHGAWVYGVGVCVMAFATAGLMRAHHGGFMNVFMPLHWILSAAFVALLADVLEELPEARGPALAAGLSLVQLGFIRSGYDLDRLVPEEADVAAGWRVVEAMRGREGPVLSPFASWIPAQAGHAPSFHLIALWDVRHPAGPYREEAAAVIHAIAERHWGTILDAPESMGFGVAKHYSKATTVYLEGRTLMPRTGWRRRPAVVWTPGGKGEEGAAAEPSDTQDGP